MHIPIDAYQLGDVVELTQDCLDNPPGTLGVCFEEYFIGRQGRSFIFANGRYDGFGPDEKHLIKRIGRRPELAKYKFENVQQVVRDFESGHFDAAFNPKNFDRKSRMEMQFKNAQEWEDRELRDNGYVVHYVMGATYNPAPPMGLAGADFHTHGLRDGFSHPEIQFCLPIDRNMVHYMFATIAKRVKAGERFAAGIHYDKIIEAMPVTFMEVTLAGGQQGLRLIIPDSEGKLEESPNPVYAFQRKAVLQGQP